ncbi:MAG: PAS domain S-box protein [Candidatus Bathyarchaeota archaeon]|nr:PAS domain S-box protein [Candidatus Bathyarchaeota archaeon]
MSGQNDGFYVKIVESIPMSVIVVNRLGFVTYVNQAISNFTEFNPEEIIGKHFTTLGFLTPREITKLVPLFADAIMGKPVKTFETQYTSRTGKQGWGRGRANLLRENGSITGVLIITEEITEQKLLGEKLKNSEEKHNILRDATLEGWIETQIDGKIISLNQVGAHILGYEPEELVGTNIIQLYANPKEREKIVKEMIKRYVADYRVEFKTKNGETKYVSLNGTLYEDKTINEKFFIIAFRDATEQINYLTKLEALLRHSAKLSKAVTLDEVAEITQETLTQTIGFDRGSMGIVEDDTLNHKYIWGIATDQEFKLSLNGPGVTVRAVNTGETQLLSDVKGDPVFLPGLGQMVTRSELTVPIKINEKVVAVINVENEKVDAFNEIDQKLVEVYAEQVSSVLQRLQSVEVQRALLERYRRFSDAAVESFVLLDRDFNILDMNLEGAKRFGLSQEEVIGKSLFDIQPSLKDSERHRQYLHVLETGQSLTIDVFDHPTGIEYLRMHAFKVGNGLGLIASDLSEIKREQEAKAQLNQELFEQKILSEQLVEIDRMKTNFMNTATHEIRTPITSIKGYSELIELITLEHDDPELMKYLEAIQRNVERLEHLSNDLLDVQRIESGRMVINKTWVNIRDLMDGIQQEMTPLITDKKQTLEVNIQTTETSIICDEMRIVQVLINLVNNASHYSPKNTTITITVEKEDDMHLITIRDQGEGLTPQDISKLFKPFPDIKARVQRGTGLGLSICKGIVNLHGGEIWAESDGHGKGSSFSFTIPM